MAARHPRFTAAVSVEAGPLRSLARRRGSQGSGRDSGAAPVRSDRSGKTAESFRAKRRARPGRAPAEAVLSPHTAHVSRLRRARCACRPFAADESRADSKNAAVGIFGGSALATMHCRGSTVPPKEYADKGAPMKTISSAVYGLAATLIFPPFTQYVNAQPRATV